MVRDDQMPLPGRGPGFQIAAVLLVLVSLSATGFLMLRWLREADASPPAGAVAQSPAPPPTRLFYDWPKDVKPELVVLLTGEQHGYLQPCGCTSPQYGGLERRYNFIEQLKKQRGWQVVALDVGDIAQDHGAQRLAKYVTTMKALKIMNYGAVGLGLNELKIGLVETLASYALNEKKPPVLAANLDKESRLDCVGEFKIVGEGTQPRLLVIGVVGQSVIDKKPPDPDAKFPEGNTAVIKRLLAQPMKEKVDLRVLLYAGSIAEAKKCAETFPQFDVIVCEAEDSEPPANPEKVGNTLVINTGHKGRSVGLLGIYRTTKADRPFDLRYQLVPLGPEYATPEGQEKGHPILELYEEYARKVRDADFLGQHGKRKSSFQVDYPDATYVGSDACKKCHDVSYAIWKKSAHSDAHDTLVKAKRPSLRQFDAECIICHVTGFEYVSGFTVEKKTPKLLDVGCESCHGPGSVHVKNQNINKTDAVLNARMNPFKPVKDETPEQKNSRLWRMSKACRECHDSDNDVHWDKDWFTKKWKLIEHYEPKD